MSIESHILIVNCPTCKNQNQVVYGSSIPLKFQCQHCDKIINMYNEKDVIDQTRVRVGKIQKEDR